MASADLDETDRAEVESVLASGRLSMGLKTDEFEEATAAYCGAKYGVAVASGTAGLHLLSIAAGLEYGDEVITTSFSFVASTNCFLYLGARPRFVDIEPATYCIDPSLIEAAITPKTKAIIAVDVFGHPADWDRILEIGKQYGLAVIADACESLGARYKDRRTGPFGIGGVFAYFPNKQMTTGEGGMIVTDDEPVARLCRSLRNQGREEGGSWLGHTLLGYNYRIDEMSAALGLSQLRRIDRMLARRRAVADRYTSLLEAEIRVKTPHRSLRDLESPFVYVVEILTEVERESVMQRLAGKDIPTRGYFSPIHRQPYMLKHFPGEIPRLPITERVAAKTIALPFHNNLSDEDARRVVHLLREALDELS